MDREEYKVRLETIKTLANDGDFKAAADVADTVDWKRVRSVRTLCMIGEIYEASGRYEDTNRILQYAYWRAPGSKTVLYRLTEVNIKAAHFEDATKYCDEFELASSKDSTRYLLRYKLLRARGSSLDEQIRMLEAYRESEFTERWAYELAQLYKENGQNEECVRLCDDMILWFSEGKYVTRAMELKMSIQPLTMEQQRKYNARTIDNEPDAPEASYGYSSAKEEREAAVRAEELSSSFRSAGEVPNRLAQGIRSVFAGMRAGDPIQEEENEDKESRVASLEEDTSSTLTAEDAPELPVQELEPEEIRNVAVTVEKEEEEDTQLTLDDVAKKPSPSTVDLEELLSETQMNLASAVASGDYTRMDDLPLNEEIIAAAQEDGEETIPTGQLSFEDMPQEEAPIPEDMTDLPGIPTPKEEESEEMDPLTRLYGKETDETLGLTRQFNLQEEVAKALRQSPPSRTETEEERHRRAVEATLRSAGVSIGSADETEEVIPDGAKEVIPDEAEEAAMPDAVTENATEEGLETAMTEDEMESEGEDLPESDPLIRDIMEEPEVFVKLPVEARPMTDDEKELFAYFTKVPGMSDQITAALADIHNNTGDKTSRSGNVMIIGRQGAGKTHLSDLLMLAICRELGVKAVRSAKIIAEDFNDRSPAEVISRIMGGFLVIEGAGDLSDDTVEKLLRAMEFRTDDLVVMLEDEKADLKSLLSRHPELEEKFTSTIVIPVFTNDELVTFAKMYAKEKGYRMDEMGVLALYTMIGDNQTATEPVTIRRVKQMMDDAIGRAESGTRRIGRRFSKRALDKDGRILLHEKDFDY